MSMDTGQFVGHLTPSQSCDSEGGGGAVVLLMLNLGQVKLCQIFPTLAKYRKQTPSLIFFNKNLE